MKTINTTRLGQVSFSDSEVINFRDGILGFPNLTKYITVKRAPFIYLQSIENAAVCFPMVNSGMLGCKWNDRFYIVTIPNDPTLMSANEKAPVYIVESCFENFTAEGAQVVKPDTNLMIRKPCWDFIKNNIGGSK
jgi:flagellar assembly factor FliW